MKVLNSRIQKLCSRDAFTDSSVKSKQGTDSSVDINIFTDIISDYFTDSGLESMSHINEKMYRVRLQKQKPKLIAFFHVILN